MSYTPSDITQLKTLAYHPDLANALLVLELIKGKGWDQRLTTVLYWLSFRLLTEEKEEASKEASEILQQAVPEIVSLDSFVEWLTIPITSFLQQYAAPIAACGIDCEEIAKVFYQLYASSELNNRTPFLFRFGTPEMRKKLLPLLVRKQHTGINSLDFSEQQLKQVPLEILALEEVQELNLDHNQLTVLPDNWSTLSQLEILHLTSNQLSSLPTSFAHLHALKRLYIQDNPWDIQQLTAVLKTLPALEYLSVAAHPQDSLYALEALVQHGLLQASTSVQRLFLALELQEAAALEQLSLLELFMGLQHEQEAVRALVRARLLSLRPQSPTPIQKENSSIAILGLVSFGVREHLEQLQQQGWSITNEITASTSHILLGDHPENYEAVAERTFMFLSAQEVLML